MIGTGFRRRIIIGIAVAAVLFGMYFSAFLGSLRGMYVSFEDGSVSVIYFSNDESTNVALYWLFYPLHCPVSGSSAELNQRLWNRYDQSSPRLSRRYFIKDISMLKKAGLRVL
jgi:hypothetical protein